MLPLIYNGDENPSRGLTSLCLVWCLVHLWLLGGPCGQRGCSGSQAWHFCPLVERCRTTTWESCRCLRAGRLMFSRRRCQLCSQILALALGLAMLHQAPYFELSLKDINSPVPTHHFFYLPMLLLFAAAWCFLTPGGTQSQDKNHHQNKLFGQSGQAGETQLNEAATRGEGCSNKPCHQLQGLQAQEQIHTHKISFSDTVGNPLSCVWLCKLIQMPY